MYYNKRVKLNKRLPAKGKYPLITPKGRIINGLWILEMTRLKTDVNIEY